MKPTPAQIEAAFKVIREGGPYPHASDQTCREYAEEVLTAALNAEAREKFTPCPWPIGSCPHPLACECADRREGKRP